MKRCAPKVFVLPLSEKRSPKSPLAIASTLALNPFSRALVAAIRRCPEPPSIAHSLFLFAQDSFVRSISANPPPSTTPISPITPGMDTSYVSTVEKSSNFTITASMYANRSLQRITDSVPAGSTCKSKPPAMPSGKKAPAPEAVVPQSGFQKSNSTGLFPNARSPNLTLARQGSLRRFQGCI